MSHKTAECCKKCEHLTENGGCKSLYWCCIRWRRWFHKEWTQIQKDFGAYKAKKETEAPK